MVERAFFWLLALLVAMGDAYWWKQYRRARTRLGLKNDERPRQGIGP